MRRQHKEIELMNVFRGIACIFIFMFHFTARFAEIFLPQIDHVILKIFGGGYAFTVTFMLFSGFFVFGNEEIGFLKFLKKKFIRIYPAYIVSVILIFTITSLWLPERSVSIVSFIASIFCVSTPLALESVDGAHWYIYTEIIFILIFALVNRIGRKSKDLMWLLVTVACVCLVAINRFFNIRLFNIAYVITQARYIPIFILGYVIASLRQKTMARRYVGAIIGISFVSLCLTLDLYQWIVAILTVVVLILVTFNGAVRDLKLKQIIILKPIFFLASISYPIYLVHQNIGYTIMHILYERLGYFSVWFILPAIAVSIALGWLIHRFVEIPIAKKMIKNKGTE